MLRKELNERSPVRVLEASQVLLEITNISVALDDVEVAVFLRDDRTGEVQVVGEARMCSMFIGGVLLLPQL